jgi:hydrogenase expression/formation protein HypD
MKTDLHSVDRTRQMLTLLQNEMTGLEEIRLMEFCGGHTHQLVKSGLMSLLPKNLKMIHGPGCPVCVLPSEHIQCALNLFEQEKNLTLACFGDLMRIPTPNGDSLLAARSRGLDIRMVYDPLTLLELAKNEPHRQILFLALGFETTAPSTALLLLKAQQQNILNLKVYCLHVTTPPAIAVVMENLTPARRPLGLIGPGNVSLVTGLKLYQEAADRYHVPICISGFETDDLLMSMIILVKAIKQNKHTVTNQYSRALRQEGNIYAQELLQKVFKLRNSFYWRGLGEIPKSAYMISEEYQNFDAEKFYSLQITDIKEPKACQCGAILKGEKSPTDCKLYGKVCTPSRPMGPCMVSSEGACGAYFHQGIS